MSWLHRIRLRVLAFLLGVTLMAIGAVSFAALPLWPVVGVAVAAAAFAVNSLTAKMAGPVCWGCGTDLDQITPGEHGRICPNCGSISRSIELSQSDQEPDDESLSS